MGDAGERGPPGPDGNEVRTCARFLFSMSNTSVFILELWLLLFVLSH